MWMILGYTQGYSIPPPTSVFVPLPVSHYRFYPASHYDFHSQLPTSLSTFCRPFILSDALPLDYEVLQMAFIAYLQEFFGKFKKYQPISCVVIISLQPVLACFTDSDRVKPGPKIRYLGLARKIKGTLK